MEIEDVESIYCAHCGDEIEDNDEYYEYEGEPYCCSDCLIEYMEDMGEVDYKIHGSDEYE